MKAPKEHQFKIGDRVRVRFHGTESLGGTVASRTMAYGWFVQLDGDIYSTRFKNSDLEPEPVVDSLANLVDE